MNKRIDCMSDLENENPPKPKLCEWDSRPTKIREKSKLSKFAEYSMPIYTLISLSVFFIPIKVLDKSEACASFVKFMKGIFPNIEAFEAISAMPQVTAFYVSFMWIWVIVCSALMIYLSFYNMPNIYDLKVFPKGIPAIIFTFFLIYLGTTYYYLGEMATGEISFGLKSFNLYFTSKIKMYFWITFFSLWFIAGCGVGSWGLIFTICGFKNLKKY